MASNIAHPFLWNILDYFVLNFLCSTKQKTGRIFTHKHTKYLPNCPLAERTAMDKVFLKIPDIFKTGFLFNE